MSALLDVREVTLTFGGRRALDNVSVAAEPGSITGLIGPNGAGKTTCFNAICGLLQPNAGSMRLDGVELGHLSPTKRARHGLARTFQRLEMFTMLSTRDNVRVAVEGHRSWSRKREPVNERVDELLAKVGLSEVGERRVTDLSTGQGRMLEIARALACHPRVLLLDEPAAGQDESETERFAGLLRELVAGGMAVLMVEHDMRLVMGECHSVTVLDAGRVIASGTPDEVRVNKDVQAAYLGDEVA